MCKLNTRAFSHPQKTIRAETLTDKAFGPNTTPPTVYTRGQETGDGTNAASELEELDLSGTRTTDRGIELRLAGTIDRWPARDEGILQKEIAQGQLGGFCDPDTGGSGDVARAIAIVTDPEATGRRGEIQTVVAGARDAESLAEAAGAAGESGKIAGTVQLDFPGTSHGGNARERLQGTEKDASGLSLGFAGDVQAVVVSVNEINIGVTGRAEQYGIAQGAAGGGVSRRIVEAEVGFDFDDAGGELRGAGFAEQDLAEKLSGYPPGIAGEEGTIERPDWGGVSGLRARHSGNGTRGGSGLSDAGRKGCATGARAAEAAQR